MVKNVKKSGPKTTLLKLELFIEPFQISLRRSENRLSNQGVSLVTKQYIILDFSYANGEFQLGGVASQNKGGGQISVISAVADNDRPNSCSLLGLFNIDILWQNHGQNMSFFTKRSSMIFFRSFKLDVQKPSNQSQDRLKPAKSQKLSHVLNEP